MTISLLIIPLIWLLEWAKNSWHQRKSVYLWQCVHFSAVAWIVAWLCKSSGPWGFLGVAALGVVLASVVSLKTPKGSFWKRPIWTRCVRLSDGESGFCKALKRIRQELGLKQCDLAKMSGVASQSLSRMESGRIANVRGDNLCRLADALHVTADELLGRTQTKTSRFDRWHVLSFLSSWPVEIVVLLGLPWWYVPLAAIPSVAIWIFLRPDHWGRSQWDPRKYLSDDSYQSDSSRPITVKRDPPRPWPEPPSQ